MGRLTNLHTSLEKEKHIVHHKIENEEYVNEDLRSIEILNSQLEAVTFKDVNVSNSDLFSTKLFSVIYDNVDFSNSDINSIWASNCKFNKVKFDGSTLTDSTFIECQFTDCTFSHIGMTGNQFIGCKLINYYADHCTITLNEFTNCYIENAHFWSTFYYQIFEKCSFVNIDFDISLLGFNYGLAGGIGTFNQEDISKLKTYFLSKGQLLNSAFVEINNNKHMLNSAILACIFTISKMMEKDLIIKADEFSFVIKLIEHFSKNEQIAPICTIECWKSLQNLQKENLETSAYIKASDSIQKLKNLLYFNYQDYVVKLSDKIRSLALPEGEIALNIHYHTKPRKELVSIINSFISDAGIQIPKAIIDKQTEGSFIEWITTNAEIVPYIQAFVTLLGIIIPIAISERKPNRHEHQKKATNHKGVITQIPLASTCQISTTKILVPMLTPTNDSTEKIVSQVIQISIENKIISSPDYLGYNSNNIISININHVA